MSRVLELPTNTEERNDLLKKVNCDPENIRKMSDDDIKSMLNDKLVNVDYFSGNDGVISSCLIDLLFEIVNERDL
jgi:hypothetical protein